MMVKPPSRRVGPRVSASAFCSQHYDTYERHGVILDFSADGLRLQRPLGGPGGRTLQLEFELPEVDEVVWAAGEVRFDHVVQVPPAAALSGVPTGVVRTTGVRLVAAATRHLRMLREYVVETARQRSREVARIERAAETDWLMSASCYRG